MERRRHGILTAVLAVAALPGTALAQQAGLGPAPTAEEIVACTRRAAPQSTMRQSLSLHIVDRCGGRTTLGLELQWERADEGLSRMRIETTAPPVLEDSWAVFVQHADRDDELFVHLAQLGETRRVRGPGTARSIFGSDFRYEELEYVRSLAGEGRVTRLPDAPTIEGRPTYAIETRPSEEMAAVYERVVSYVDQETCVPLRIEFERKGRVVHKRLTIPFDRVDRIGEAWIPREIAIEDLVDGTRSVLEVDRVEVGPILPEGTFDPVPATTP